MEAQNHVENLVLSLFLPLKGLIPSMFGKKPPLVFRPKLVCFAVGAKLGIGIICYGCPFLLGFRVNFGGAFSLAYVQTLSISETLEQFTWMGPPLGWVLWQVGSLAALWCFVVHWTGKENESIPWTRPFVGGCVQFSICFASLSALN